MTWELVCVKCKKDKCLVTVNFEKDDQYSVQSPKALAKELMRWLKGETIGHSNNTTPRRFR
jgi:hypothetical protein